MIYYTADLHFHYAPVLSDRPFETVEEMDHMLIQNWNAAVSPKDTVYLVGDIGYNGGHVPCRILAQLNGEKHLVRGNHDTGFKDAPLLYRFFKTVTDFNELDDGGTHILLCHYPILYNKRGYMIHGHFHDGGAFRETLRGLPRVLNAGVDVNGYRPVTLAQLIENNSTLYHTVGKPSPRVPRDLSGRLPQKANFRPIPQKPASHPRHLFLTGEKQVGKSTVLRNLLEGRDASIGGFRTVRLRTPEGGAVHMLPAFGETACTPETLLFTKQNGVLFVDPARFDLLGRAILDGCGACDLLLMDELGPAESEAHAFQQAVLRRLDGTVPVYGVLQQGQTDFLDQLKAHPQVQLITVTPENRDLLPQRLLEEGW